MIKKAKVAVIDNGGRGTALVNAYAKSEYVDSIIAIPGNDMMKFGLEKPVQTFPNLKTTSVKEILSICRLNNVSLVDVAQDAAIEFGLVDALRKINVTVLGPTKSASEIEWNKVFARELGKMQSLPQPIYKVCRSEKEGIEYIKIHPETSVFVKASGLADGKGAIPARNRDEAIRAIKEMNRFGNSGKVFLIEQWLRNDDGSNAEEFSTFAMSDGSTVKILGSAQDHKRVNNFDEGPNTGGMGCSTPPLVLTKALIFEIESMFNTIINSLNVQNRKYTGIIYLGGILKYEHGVPKPYIVEWNARWGDPEAQVLIPGIKTDMFELSTAATNNTINSIDIETDGKARVVVAGVSKGYPVDYNAVKGKRIFGLTDAAAIKGIKLYGAGVGVEDGKYYASGGRLFYIVSEGITVIQARERAYAAMSHISVEDNNLHFRDDIGWRDVARLRR